MYIANFEINPPPPSSLTGTKGGLSPTSHKSWPKLHMCQPRRSGNSGQKCASISPPFISSSLVTDCTSLEVYKSKLGLAPSGVIILEINGGAAEIKPLYTYTTAWGLICFSHWSSNEPTNICNSLSRTWYLLGVHHGGYPLHCFNRAARNAKQAKITKWRISANTGTGIYNLPFTFRRDIHCDRDLINQTC